MSKKKLVYPYEGYSSSGSDADYEQPMKSKDEIKEIGFNDSYYSEGFKEGIPIINSLLKKYGLKIQTKFIDANNEPEYRHSLTIERIE